jgi:hypothetical protein
MSKKHSFTKDIFEIMKGRFGGSSETIYNLSPLLQYLNNKTRSANRGSKSRSSFANLYAIYVLVEDYLKIMKEEKIIYSDYSGADYSPYSFDSGKPMNARSPVRKLTQVGQKLGMAHFAIWGSRLSFEMLELRNVVMEKFLLLYEVYEDMSIVAEQIYALYSQAKIEYNEE